MDGRRVFRSSALLASLLKKFRGHGAVAFAASLLIRLLGITVRLQVVDECGVTKKGKLSEPIIWLFWHNRVLLMPYFQRKLCPERHGAVLTSPSQDGEIIAGVMRRFGVDAVRGSSNKRPAAALREMARLMKAGEDIAITPDGPRGPRYHLQGGPVKLAQLSGSPLMAIHLGYARAWRLKTWDNFLIPKPFTKAKLTFAPLRSVPRDADGDALEQIRAEIEREMKLAAESSE